LWKKIHHHPFADSEGDRGFFISAVTKDGRVLTLIPRTLAAAAAFLNVLNPKKSQQIETCNNLSMILLVYLFGACYFCDFHLASAQERQHESTWAFAFS